MKKIIAFVVLILSVAFSSCITCNPIVIKDIEQKKITNEMSLDEYVKAMAFNDEKKTDFIIDIIAQIKAGHRNVDLRKKQQ